MKRIERQSRMMMKVRRIQLLQELDSLHDKLCKQCVPITKVIKGGCTCQSSLRIHEIGEELLELVKTPKSAILGQLIGMKLENLTVELYMELDEIGISDADIMKTMRIRHARFFEWKREKKLTRQTKTA